jgi:hypothetical protein
MLEQRLQEALADVARRFAAAGVDYYLGGSCMLRLYGYDVVVGDVDVVVPGDARPRVMQALANLEIDQPQSTEPWRTGWMLRTGLETTEGSVDLDIMGDLAIEIDGEVARFPFAAHDRFNLGDMLIPLGDIAAWYHLYRVHNPARAALIAGRLSDEEIMAAARRLSIDHLFSPTLIVRIGDGPR